MTSNISNLERAKITLENQNESLKTQMSAKEKMTNEMKEEYENEKLEQQEKFDDVKHKLETKEDELNSKNISFEKE